MREDIENLINEQLDKIDDDYDEELIKEIEEKVKNQNKEIQDKAERRKIIKSFLKNNNIKSLDELSDDQIKNILNYKI